LPNQHRDTCCILKLHPTIMYFALDTDDLKKLKEQIDKAEKQLEILKLQTELNFIDIK